jgi:hypothetical protein
MDNPVGADFNLGESSREVDGRTVRRSLDFLRMTQSGRRDHHSDQAAHQARNSFSAKGHGSRLLILETKLDPRLP